MGKMKKRIRSLKWSLILYLPFALIVSVAGAFAIGVGTNSLQAWYLNNHPELYNTVDAAAAGEDGEIYKEPWESEYYTGYVVISGAQYVLVPLWVMFCFAAAVSGNTPVGYMASLMYYIANIGLKDRLGKLYLFSMSTGGFEEKYWMAAVSVVLLALGFILRSGGMRLKQNHPTKTNHKKVKTV